MIERMAKIEIIGLLDELDTALDLLQEEGIVQIDDIPAVDQSRGERFHRIHMDEKKSYLLTLYEELLTAVRDIMENLNEGGIVDVDLDEAERDRIAALGPDSLMEEIAPVLRDTRRLIRKRKNLHQDQESARQYEELISTFLPFLDEAGNLEHHEQFGVVLRKGDAAVLPIMRARLTEVTGPDTLVFHGEMPDGKMGVCIMAAQEDLAAVQHILGNENIDEYRLPREFRRANHRESIAAIRTRLLEIPAELLEVHTQLVDLKHRHYAVLRAILVVATNRLDQLRILSRLVRTRSTFVISGWTPVSALERLRGLLDERFRGSVYLGSVRKNARDRRLIPTHLINPGMLGSAEVLMKLLPPPSYASIDATPLIGVFFPFFFGAILGDMAYGLVLLAIAGIIRWRARAGSLMAKAGTVALMAGTSTVLFGFLYGEFLGNLGAHWGLHALAPWLHRETSVVSLLLLALAVGVFHIALGYALKILLGIMHHHYKEAIEGASKIAVIAGVVAIFLQFLIGFPLPVRYIGMALSGVGLVGILFTEGFLGLLELFSMLGNILSYSRIMAIGLSSVILAAVANRLAAATENIVIGVLIGFLIHAVNFVMGVFSPTIHSLRLHYVEFFSKFFIAQGTPFKPFHKLKEGII